VTQPSPLRLSNAAELLFRQVHPTQAPPEGMSKEAFIPNPDDAGRMSTHREAIGAAEAFRRYTEEEGRVSAGTWAVTVGEVDDVGAHALDDALVMKKPDHASIDFNPLATKGQWKRAARKLRDAATARTCLYTP
jgi:hypothetical protein